MTKKYLEFLSFRGLRLRRLGNLFLVSLAIADLCVGALVMTFALANDLMEYWPFWPQLCEIWIAFDISCSTCSIINLCAIALDRFAHIKDPMLYNRWMNKRIVIAAVSIIWILSGLISFLPISLGWHKPLPSSSATTIVNRMNNTSNLISPSTMMTIIELNRGYDHHRRIDKRFSFSQSPEIIEQQRQKRSIDRQQPVSEFDYRPLFFTMFRQQNISTMATIGRAPSFYLPVPIFAENEQIHSETESIEDEIDRDDNQLKEQQVIFATLRHSRHYSTVYSNQINDQIHHYEKQEKKSDKIGHKNSISTSSSSSNCINDCDTNVESTTIIPQIQDLPQCALDLTPTYAVISSCISFYLPCLIMLCLYARLYSICKQHVKTIKSMTKMIAPCPQPGFITTTNTVMTAEIRNQQQQQNPLLTDSIKMTINHNNNQIVTDGQNKRHSSTTTNPGTLNHHHSNQFQHQQQQQQSHVSEHKAAITLGIIMGTFLACWMPFFFMNIVAAFCKTCIPASVFKLLTWLGYFNSCLNPAIYSIFNTEFREAFRRILVRYVFSSDMSQTCNRICQNSCSSMGKNRQSSTLMRTKMASINVDQEAGDCFIDDRIDRHSLQLQSNQYEQQILGKKANSSLILHQSLDHNSHHTLSNNNDEKQNIETQQSSSSDMTLKSNGHSQSSNVDTKHIDDEDDNDEKLDNNNIINLQNKVDKSRKSNEQSTVKRQSNRQYYHHHHRQRNYNNQQLYNSYSFDHCYSTTKLDRKIDTTLIAESPHHHHHRQMSSDPNINLALNRNLYNPNQNHNHNHHNQCKSDTSATSMKTTMIKQQNSSFDV
ncbi:dopamine receptor 1-like protein [Dermatophagoides farinae]|uniref:Dopamine receptor 1-like protein n=1 Tax=Dermatophagoides farinae TaxID=6954 RepID=A0A9D4NU95_DERFA|nr:dopamine receptor 1-like protein [Dermatophagoides farinae]